MALEHHFTVLMLMEYIRRQILNVGKGESFFIKVRSQLRKTTDCIGQLYEKYKELADQEPNVFFVGRLANYKYFNMDQAIKNAFDFYDKHIKELV